MLHRHTAAGVEPLADALAEVLAVPLDDPMEPELVLAPTQGLLQWLRRRLSLTLGTSGAGRADGVAANLEVGFPGLVRQRALAAGRGPGTADPWAVDHLTWTVLDVLQDAEGDPDLGPARRLPEGATPYGRARRLADLFDRYDLRRPAMVRAWAEGRDVDAEGRPLPPHQRWQPSLWRAVRRRVAEPSAAERSPRVVAGLAEGTVVAPLPERFCLFGLTSAPGGLTLELLEALGTAHEVHLFLNDLSPGLSHATRRVLASQPSPPTALRADDPTAAGVEHPLLASWARPSREATVLWAPATTETAEEPPPEVGDRPPTLLAHLQGDLRHGTRPSGTFHPAPDDRSVQVHACHGQIRQVEVLRDALLHLLVDDPTLQEDDIVVLCPDLDAFAPLVESVFGSPAHGADDAGAGRRPSATARDLLHYRITDRSLRDAYPTLAALGALVDLLDSRFSASAVLDLVRQPAVRRRYGFTDDELSAIVGWVGAADVRWGLDGPHREVLAGIPAEHRALSWQAAVERLLLGVAASDDDLALTAGAVLPLDVEGTGVGVAGRLGDLLARLADLAAAAATPRPVGEWSTLLAGAADHLVEAPADEPWQLSRLHHTLHEIAAAAEAGGGAAVALSLQDVQRLLGEHLDGPPRRPAFFRGGVTVSSLTPLRGIPHRVVAVLGLDEGALGAAGVDGDDLAATPARIGDPDPRAEGRQALLEALLAARDHLVITRTGSSVVTNQPVPPCTPLAELADAVRLTLHPGHRGPGGHRVEVEHPRQAYDERNFSPGAVAGTGPWSFDPTGLAGARARTGERAEPGPFLAGPLDVPAIEVVDLADLHLVLRDPIAAFLRRRLRVHLARDVETGSEDLPTHLGGLDEWQVADRLLTNRLAGGDDSSWLARERARGALPPGSIGDELVDRLTGQVDALMSASEAHGLRAGTTPRTEAIDVTLGDGTRVVGVVDDHGGTRPGPARISCSSAKAVHQLTAWLDLLALTAQDPERHWWSLLLNRSKAKTRPVDVHVLELTGESPDERAEVARRALEVAVDCYRRSQAEPFPLFASLSPALVDGKAARGTWRRATPTAPPGDGDRPGARLVFGDATFDDLLAVPALDGDPPGESASRVTRCAEHLWGTLRRSVLDVDADRTAVAP